MVRVVEFGDAGELDLLSASLALELLGLLELGKGEDGVDDGGLLHGLEELGGEDAGGAEGLRAGGERLLGLRVEGRVLDEAVHKHAEVVLDLVRLDLGALVLLLDDGNEVAGDLVGDVGGVLPTLVRVDGVHERDLLEAASLADGDADLPAVVDLLEGDGGGNVVVEGDVVLKRLDLDAISVEEDLELLALGGGHGSGDVVGAAGEEADGALIELGL